MVHVVCMYILIQVRRILKPLQSAIRCVPIAKVLVMSVLML